MAKYTNDLNINDIIIGIVSRSDYKPADHFKLFTMYKDLYGSNIKYDDFVGAVASLERGALLSVTNKGKIMLPDSSNVIRGEFRASSKGFGFVVPADAEFRHDLYIAPENTMNALNGDIVAVNILGCNPAKRDRNDNSREGKIIKIFEHKIKTVVGTLMQANSRVKKQAALYVVPDDPKLRLHITVDDGGDRGVVAPVGSKVEIEITEYPKEYPSDNFAGSIRAYGRLIRAFGDTQTLEANYSAVLYEHNIKTEFDSETLEQAALCGNDVLLPGVRLDLRNKIIFTADGEDAKDLDDAVSVEKTHDGYILGVHIADVSAYVPADSPLDREAYERGTSVYFADKVIPMLPESLSNGICSLTNGRDRYALSAFITLSDKGEILECNLCESIISTAVRGIYSELNDLISKGGDSQYTDKYRGLLSGALDTAVELYEVLESKSRSRGMLELETTEAKVLIGEDNRISDIVKRRRGIAERLVEQFMLCANEAVANWLYWQCMPCIYRVHNDPSPEKIQAFSVFAHNLGLNISPLRSKNIHSLSLQKVLDQAYERGLGGVTSFVLLRSLMKANYSAAASPHFGLAIDKYCHFTSPIRRYPDLIVHRIIKTILHGGADEETVNDYFEFTELAAKQASDAEMRAARAERDIEDLYKAVYMSDKIGETFEGVITSVLSFGLFVELDNTCEGFVPVSSLDGYFEFDENNLRLYCGYRSYALGENVDVRIEKADIITRRIEMRLV